MEHWESPEAGRRDAAIATLQQQPRKASLRWTHPLLGSANGEEAVLNPASLLAPKSARCSSSHGPGGTALN